MQAGEAQIAELLARQAITNIFPRYAHGIDRCDLAMLEGIWWPEARADFGQGFVDALQWCTDVIAFLRTMTRTQHIISNIMISFEDDGQRANSQAYVQAFHEIPDENGVAQDIIMGGRYLDIFECRQGEWRLLQRRFVLDWNSNRRSSASWSDGIYAALTRHGGRAPHDPYYSGV